MTKEQISKLIEQNLPIAISNSKGKIVYPFINQNVPKVIAEMLTEVIFNNLVIKNETPKDSTNKDKKEVCGFCSSDKIYDVFFDLWCCPVCDNVKQAG